MDKDFDYLLFSVHLVWETLLIPYYELSTIYVRAKDRQKKKIFYNTL
jgi:hypothetical protein